MMPEDTTKKPIDKSRRAVVLATVGIVVIMGLAVFYVAVVAPLRETHAVVRRYWHAISTAPSLNDTRRDAAKLVVRLGGPNRAAHKLRSYLNWPRWLAPDKPTATYLLGHCGETAEPVLLKLVRDETEAEDVRLAAFNALIRLITPPHPRQMWNGYDSLPPPGEVGLILRQCRLLRKAFPQREAQRTDDPLDDDTPAIPEDAP